MKYTLQLQHPLWYEKREDIKLRDLNKCVKCGSRIKLAVHHLYYEKSLKAWEYPDEAYITLCESCHNAVHKVETIKIKSKPTKLNFRKKVALLDIKSVALSLQQIINEAMSTYPDLFEKNCIYLIPKKLRKKDYNNKQYKEYVNIQEKYSEQQSLIRTANMLYLKEIEAELKNIIKT